MNIGYVERLVQKPDLQVDWIDRLDIDPQYDPLNDLIFDLESEMSNIQSKNPEKFKNIVSVRSYIDFIKSRIHIIFAKILEDGQMGVLRMESSSTTLQEYFKLSSLLTAHQVPHNIFEPDPEP